MLRVVIVSIAFAVIGVLYILANPGDAGVRGFGWFLVAVGVLIAAAFTALWAKDQLSEGRRGERDEDKRPVGRGRKARRRRT